MTATVITTLSPCPFCGTGSKSWRDKWDPNGGPMLDTEQAHASPTDHFVKCRNCWARGPVRDDPQLALEAWNKRVAQ